MTCAAATDRVLEPPASSHRPRARGQDQCVRDRPGHCAVVAQFAVGECAELMGFDERGNVDGRRPIRQSALANRWMLTSTNVRR